MKKIILNIRLAILGFSKYARYARQKSNDNTRVIDRILSFLVCFIVVITCIKLSIAVGERSCVYTGFNKIITSENIGDYLGLLATHCSVVFLTTSLMTMLSEHSKYVYHVDLVELVLINPPGYNFLALVIYAMSSIALAMLGFIVKKGSCVIGGFIFGVVVVVILFWRMVRIYYRKKYHKNGIKKFLKKTIMLVREMEDKKITAEYKKPMKQVGYNRHFDAILERALVALENNNFSDVIEIVELLESCIKWHVGDTYEDKKQEKTEVKEEAEAEVEVKGKNEKIEEAYKILISEIGLNRSYRAATRLYMEKIYINFVSVIATKYPEELQKYYNDPFTEEPSDYLKMLRSIIFPYILNSYIEMGRKQRFFSVLTNWSERNEYWLAIRNYVVDCAIHGHADYLAEYYDRVVYSSVSKLVYAEKNCYRICPKRNLFDTIFIEHEKALEQIYNESVEVFEQILSYKNNRKNFIDFFTHDFFFPADKDENDTDTDTDKDSDIVRDFEINDIMEKCVCLSETATIDRKTAKFFEVVEELIKRMLISENEELVESFTSLIKRIIEVEVDGERKTNADVEYLLTHIYKWMCEQISSMDNRVSFYGCLTCQSEFEYDEKKIKEATDKSFNNFLNIYIQALEERMDTWKYETQFSTNENDPRKKRIFILENILENIEKEHGKEMKSVED